MDLFAIICILLLAAMLALVGYGRLRNRKSDHPLTFDEVRRLLRRSLRQLSCSPSWRWEGRVLTCNYDYQGGHFHIRINSENVTAEMAFLFVYEAQTTDLDFVRQVTNLCNVNSHYVRIVYSMNDDKHTIDVHILAPLSLSRQNAKNVLQATMDEAFQWRNAFGQRYESLLEKGRADEMTDYEAERARFTHENSLLREQEIAHQPCMAKERDGFDDQLTLRSVANMLLNIESFLPKSLYVTTGDTTKRVDTDDISDYPIASAILTRKKDGTIEFAADDALLRFSFYDKRMPGKERRLVMMVNSEGADDQTLYYRLTATLIPLPAQPVTPKDSHANMPLCRSALIGFDIADTQKKLSEFSYVWQEASDKLNRGEIDQLTDDELMLAKAVVQPVAQEVFFGIRRFHQGRYLEAVGLLEQAYDFKNQMMHGIRQPKEDDWKTFNDICFYLAFCYMELRLYKQAYYYLDILLPLHRYSYTTEYVNCLVNASDLRALNMIDHLLATLSVDEQKEDDEDDDGGEKEEDTSLVSFISFLKRRKSYVLIECRRYDEAESLLKEMLNDPSSSDYAINELAFLQKLKTK